MTTQVAEQTKTMTKLEEGAGLRKAQLILLADMITNFKSAGGSESRTPHTHPPIHPPTHPRPVVGAP